MSKLAALTGTALLVLSCGRATESADAFDQLMDAVRRTEATGSFRVTITSSSGDRSVAYYQAPDRLLTRGPGGEVSIIVGSSFYLEDAERAGYFQQEPEEDFVPPPPGLPPLPELPPPDAMADAPPRPPAPSVPAQPARAAAPLPGLNVITVGAANVEDTATGFSFRLRDTGPFERGSVTVREGLIREIAVYAPQERTRFVYDQFGRALKVTAPPQDRLVPFEALPTCGHEGNPPVSTAGEVQFCQPPER